MTYPPVTNYILLQRNYTNKTNFNLNSTHKFYYSKVCISTFFCNPNRIHYLTILLFSFSYFTFFNSSSVSNNKLVFFSSNSFNPTSSTNSFNPNRFTSLYTSISSTNSSTSISSICSANSSITTNSAIFNFYFRYLINFMFKS